MKTRSLVRLALVAVAIFSAPPSVFARQLLSAGAHELILDQGLAVESTGRSGRRAINIDGVQAMIVAGTLGPVKEGDKVPLPRGMEGEPAWKSVKAEEKGIFPGERPGWLLCTVDSAAERVMVLEARGHAMVYVNGEPRMGDPYGAGFMRLPVPLKKGENQFLFASAGRGGVAAKLVEPGGDLEVIDLDLTIPDLVEEREGFSQIGVPIMNASNRELMVSIEVELPGIPSKWKLNRPTLVPLPACSVTKVPAEFWVEAMGRPTEVKARIEIKAWEKGKCETVAAHVLTLKVLEKQARHRSTYISRVDGSVQYFSIVPPAPPTPQERRSEHPALVLSLHGASVEATSQASSYKPKPNMVIVCPTNRRPFGFDWEDWGRIDAIEVMDLAAKEYNADPNRRYLTGHSMGGHGTWQLGVLYPDRFAAIAPSAGWLSFDSYVNARPDAPKPEESEMAKAFKNAAASSNTQSMLANLENHGIYILHGDADDNVPVAQARQAKELLEALRIPFEYHEQPGAGHWWGDEHSGAACMDWSPIFEMFAKCEIKRDAPRPKVEPPIDDRGFPRGSFKRVFDRDFILVYGTGRTAEENAWAFNKARFDAEQWWYRGNGTARVMPDTAFLDRMVDFAPNTNIILYGNSSSNRLWHILGDKFPVTMGTGRLTVDGRAIEGDDIGCLCAAQVGKFTIGIVGGTGIAGMRATDRIPYFTSGVGVPDVVVLRSSVWLEGMSAVEGVSLGPSPAGGVQMLWSNEPK